MTTLAQHPAPIVATRPGAVRGTREAGVASSAASPTPRRPVGDAAVPPAGAAPRRGTASATRPGSASATPELRPVEGRPMHASTRPPDGDDCLNLNVWTPDPAAVRAAGPGLDPRRRLKFGAGLRRAVRRRHLRPRRRRHRHPQLPAAPRRLPLRAGPPGRGRVRPARPDRGAGVGAGQHRGLRRRSRPGDDRRRVGRGAQRRHAARRAGRPRPVPAGDPAERRRAVRRVARGRPPSTAPSCCGGWASTPTTTRRSRRSTARPAGRLERGRARRPAPGRSRRAPGADEPRLPGHQPITSGGDVLPRRPLDPIADGAAAGVDLLIGTTLDEVGLFPPGLLRDGAGGGRGGVRRPGAAGDPTAPTTDAAQRFVTDRCSASRRSGWPRRRCRTTPRVFMYLSPGAHRRGAGRGAVHALDLPFMWDRIDAVADAISSSPVGAPSPAFAEAMHGAWVRFVTDGTPPTRSCRTGPPTSRPAGDDVARRARPRRRRPDGDERRAWHGVGY